MAVAWVQSQVDTFVTADGVATSFTYTLLHTFTKGNSLVGAIFYENTTLDITSITDNATPSNTYTLLDNTTQGGGAFCQSFALANIQNVPTTITIHTSSAPPNGNHEFMVLDEISGANSIHKHSGLENTGVTTFKSGNVTPTVNNCLFWGACFPDTSVTGITAGTNLSYTLRINDTSNGLFTETAVQAAAASQDAEFGSTTSQGGGCFVVVFDPIAIPVVDEARGNQVRRERQSPLKQQDDWIQKQTLFQTTTPPIGFDEDRGERIRRTPFRAHTTPLEDTWIQKQTLFQTTTPPIGFDEDRGQQARRVPWRARPQPDYPEQQKVTLFQTTTLPIGFDEDRGQQVRRVLWRAHSDVLVASDFLPPTVFVPLGFDEDRGRQTRRVAWRQHTQAITDDWILPPTTFVPLGFDEDRGRQIRRPWLAHPQPQDDWLQSQVTTPPIEPWGFDEEQHFQIRRPSWRQRQAGVDDFIQAPTVFVSLGFDEDRGRQIRRPWLAHPQPQDDWLLPLSIAFWGFDEEQHAQIRRQSWRARPELRDDDWIFSVIPQVTFVSWGFDEEQHARIRRTSWRQTSAMKREEAGDFSPMPPPPPKAKATGNVIFGVIRNLF